MTKHKITKTTITSLDKAAFENAIEQAMLNDFEKQVFLDYKMNVSLVESSLRLHCSEETIIRSRKAIRNKISKHI